jgi:hypothetical protein
LQKNADDSIVLVCVRGGVRPAAADPDRFTVHGIQYLKGAARQQRNL